MGVGRWRLFRGLGCGATVSEGWVVGGFNVLVADLPVCFATDARLGFKLEGPYMT